MFGIPLLQRGDQVRVVSQGTFVERDRLPRLLVVDASNLHRVFHRFLESVDKLAVFVLNVPSTSRTVSPLTIE
jgi:hypothetical protein